MPGTVSKIVWHFTGGPIWDDSLKKQGAELKPTISGYNALNSILSSGQLRLGKYKELVKVILPRWRARIPETKKYQNVVNYPVTIESRPVCCVADIPLQHLGYHAKRYGKIAIGFHRDAIIRAGFNPVMYTLEHSQFSLNVHNAYAALGDADTQMALDQLSNDLDDVNEVLERGGLEEADFSSTEWEIDAVNDKIEEAFDNYKEIISFVKTFDSSEFDSIYCEREWRSIECFDFTVDDIAMIVLPRNAEGENFYAQFIKETDLPRTVSIACWEDLLEH